MGPATAAIVGGIVGAVITGVITIITTLIHTNTEKQRHKREMATQIAMAEYNAAVEIVQSKGGMLPPPQTYIVGALKFIKEVNIDDTPENIALKLEYIRKEGEKLTELMKQNQSKSKYNKTNKNPNYKGH